MRRLLHTFLVIVTCFAPLSARSQTCSPQSSQQAAGRALALQQMLLDARPPEMDTDIPIPLRPRIHDFKQALIATTAAVMSCNNPDPSNIEPRLAQLLHANRPRPAQSTADTPDRIYGSDLAVQLHPIPQQPGLFAIQITYGIECGEDNILLLYRRTASGWVRELLWQNPDLNSVGDAFGDFFTYALVPSISPSPYLVAVAHGTPWCTSRFSVFHIDLLAPATASTPQRHLDHLRDDYSRGDRVPTLLATRTGAELRLDESSRDLNVFTYLGVFRYDTSAGNLRRVQPIANNARGFLDAWLNAPWHDASSWSAPDARTSLQATHDSFDFNKNKGTVPSLEYGPVRNCTSSPNTFQVQLNLDQTSRLYASVLQNPNSFTMLSIHSTPEPTCTGPDLMHPSP